jgi:PIN domain nuclease of toxin-antitoxin system
MIPGISTVSDTNSILWFVFEPRLLTSAAISTLRAAQAADELYIATITLVELDFLDTKPSFPYFGAKARIEALLQDPSFSLRTLDLDVQVAEAVAMVPRKEVPDLPDRVIASTAVAHKFRLVSSDRKIRNSPSLHALIQVIW